MSSDLYKSLPLEPNATRMVRLLPDKEANAEIKCELFTYGLTEIAGRKHLYEALSYVWSGDQEGSTEKYKEMRLHGHLVPITANLHAALVNLRDYQLDRVLWVDAICINQDDMDEKGMQIPLMRTIYAQADRVIVWLGEAFEHGDKALEAIRDLAEKNVMIGEGFHTQLSQSTNEACLKLLERKWFRRIWVLQEVGVARSIEIMCGSVQINGYTFCEGLSQLKIPSLLAMIHPVVYLIKGAQFRPKSGPRIRGSLHIGELIGMYRYHVASRSHDKVYALLGLAADDPNTPGLKPDYNLPWHQVFNNTIRYILSGEGSVETHPGKDTAIIQTKCWILGFILHVQDISGSNRLKINMLFNHSPESAIFKRKWGSDWMIQLSAESVRCGDILCLLRGNSNPSVIRVSGDHFSIINIAITSHQVYQNGHLSRECFRQIDSRQSPPLSITVTWIIPMSATENEVDPKGRMELTHILPDYQKLCLDTEKPSSHPRVILDAFAMQLVQQDLSSRPLEHLVDQLQAVIPVSEQVVRAAVGNTDLAGPKIVEVLLQYQDNILVTEEVLKIAASNQGFYGSKIVEMLLEYQNNVPVTKEVLKIAAGNKGLHGPRIMEILLQYQDNIPVSEEVLKVAVENKGLYGSGIVDMLLKYQDNLPVTEEVVKAAVGIIGSTGYKIVKVLLQYKDNLPVTEEVAKVAAGNKGLHGSEIMELLFRYRDNLPVTEEVVRVAAGNTGPDGHHIMEVLSKYQNDIPVTEEVVKAVAGNRGGYRSSIMRILFEHQDDILINKEMVKAMEKGAGLDTVMGKFYKRQEMIRKLGWRHKFESTARKFLREVLWVSSTKPRRGEGDLHRPRHPADPRRRAEGAVRVGMRVRDQYPSPRYI